MARFLRAAIFLALIFSAQSVFAACRVVTSSGAGSKNGADWSNAYAGLPSSLARGDIYYLADGSYGSYSFNTAASGTTMVEIRKAQPGDHCTDSGWNAGTMGASQAQFSAFNVGTSTVTGYVILNGNGTSTGAGCGQSPRTNAPKSDCGIKIQSCGATCLGLNPTNGASSSSNITVKYVEAQGAGAPYNEQNVILCRSRCDNVTLDHIFSYEAGCTFFKLTNTNSFTVLNSYFRKNYDVANACHGQMFISEGSTSNVTFANSVFQDIDGTGVFVGVTGAKMSNWTIYNNVFWRSDSNTSSNGISNGILDSINSGSQATNIQFISNTIVNLTDGNTSGFNVENSGGSFTVRNNLWYGSNQMGGYGGGNPSVTESNNSCLNMSCGGLSGTANVKVASGSPNPFVNFPAANFNLASEHANWTGWMSLGAPFNLDANGTIRSTDRGAFQFGQSQTQAPQPPTGLVVTVQ
jgi:hypothetical protein